MVSIIGLVVFRHSISDLYCILRRKWCERSNMLLYFAKSTCKTLLFTQNKKNAFECCFVGALISWWGEPS